MNTGAFSLFRLAIFLGTFIAVAPRAHSVTVSFQNSVGLPSPPERLVRDANGSLLVCQNYMAQRYWGNSPETLVALTTAPARFRTPITTTPGTWGGGTRTVPWTGAPTDPITLQVRV